MSTLLNMPKLEACPSRSGLPDVCSELRLLTKAKADWARSGRRCRILTITGRLPSPELSGLQPLLAINGRACPSSREKQEASGETYDQGDMYYHPVGPDCRKTRGLQDYTVEAK